MKRLFIAALMAGSSLVAARAQEPKPVPKDSVRVMIPGCSKGQAFTAGAPSEDQPGGTAVPEGTRLRLNGSKQLMADIRGQEGSRIEITGLIKKGQVGREGIEIGRGVRIIPGSGGPSAGFGGGTASPGAGQLMIDVEGWRHLPGDCPR
jgi:hypothetical protein